MSYDLFFRGSAVPSAADLRDYVSARAHYEVQHSQATYENPASGVSFSFDFGDALAFNLNYARPSYFALEAEPELSAFVAHFGLDVDDPQTDGMGRGPYAPEGFLRGWNAGNRSGISALGLTTATTPNLPEATNTGIWRWNASREAYVEHLSDLETLPTFVPTIMLLAPEDDPTDLQTTVVWAEAMAFMLPPVDRILVPREDQPMLTLRYAELAPLLEALPQRPADHAFTLEGHSYRTGLPHHVIGDGLTNGALFDLLTKRGEPLPKLTRIAFDRVLDAELLEA